MVDETNEEQQDSFPVTVTSSNDDVEQVETEEETEESEEESDADDGDLSQIQRLQKLLDVEPTGEWDGETDERALLMRRAAQGKQYDVEEVQSVIGESVTGEVTSNTRRYLSNWIISFQHAVGVRTTGTWTPDTNSAFLRLRKKHK